jgi:hypothetical protein
MPSLDRIVLIQADWQAEHGINIWSSQKKFRREGKIWVNIIDNHKNASEMESILSTP